MAPERTCVVCGRKRPRGVLLRIARGGDGVAVDPEARAPGRGAWVCREAGHVAALPGRLEQTLRLRLGEGDLARLREEMQRELD